LIIPTWRRRLLSRNASPIALREENVLRQAETGGESTQSDRHQATTIIDDIGAT
jgi:hypothetical protein